MFGTVRHWKDTLDWLGVQYYLRDTLWYRAGLGFATYTIETVKEETLVEDLQRSGFAFASSIGFDFVQLSDVWTFGLSKQDLALSYELNFIGALYPPGDVAGEVKQELGAIVQLTMGVGVHWY